MIRKDNKGKENILFIDGFFSIKGAESGGISVWLEKKRYETVEKKMWCVSEITDEYEERMMDILEIYERPYNPKEPVICLDEKSKQLLADTRGPLPGKPGTPERHDYEYERKGTANIFVMVEPKAGRRHIIVRKNRTYKEYSLCIYFLANLFRNVDKLLIIQDNLNTHNEKSLIKAFGEEKARKIMEKIEFHFTPKHGSWLSMAEIEISVMERECFKGRRIPYRRILHRDTNAYEKRRNDKKARINWRFTREKAREKFKLQTRHN